MASRPHAVSWSHPPEVRSKKRSRSGSRSPHRDYTNGQRSGIPLSTSNMKGTYQARTASPASLNEAFHPTLDSSEFAPSEHGSIINAETMADRGSPTRSFNTGGRSLRHSPQRTFTHDMPSQSMHMPTPLDTIVEQKSNYTLRPENTPVVVQADVPVLSPQPRRRRSRSLNDLVDAWHSLQSSSDEIAVYPRDTNPVAPNEPLRSPPLRTPTPRDLPSFGTPEAMNYQLPAPPMKFIDIFRPHGTLEEQEWERQTSNLPPGVTMRGDDGTYVRGSFRATQSGHTGMPRQAPMRRSSAIEMQSLAVESLQRVQAEHAGVEKTRGWRKCLECLCGDHQDVQDEVSVPAVPLALMHGHIV
ncbi:hypothetical protein MMC14_003299 [Varicellaria rhodocarpa]|nr:hypothetical protein [Varicellaria rhodocarpa]